MKIYRNYMLRPIIYMTATRLMAAFIFLLAVDRLVPNGPAPAMIAAFLTVLFALFAFLVYLRMDGLRIPRVKYIRPKKKKDPMQHTFSMSDYTDEEPVSFEDLEPEEKDFCSLVCNAINLIVFLVLSFIL
ncbi:MAG: hypothetical protein IKU70_03390 [Clostridia bacterium]|nr:hypothetical protein [Clostridia bacterium]